MRDMLQAAPSSWPFIEGINNHILNGEVYLALKEAKKLIAHEDKLLAERPEACKTQNPPDPAHPPHHTHPPGKKASRRRPFVFGACNRRSVAERI